MRQHPFPKHKQSYGIRKRQEQLSENMVWNVEDVPPSAASHKPFGADRFCWDA
jgi:hypothetical protein